MLDSGLVASTGPVTPFCVEVPWHDLSISLIGRRIAELLLTYLQVYVSEKSGSFGDDDQPARPNGSSRLSLRNAHHVSGRR